MAEPLPQSDLPNRLSGGSDTWDDGLAGAILSADYFQSAPIAGTLTATLGDLTLSATGTIGAASISGTLTATLDALTLSAASDIDITGQLSGALAALTSTATGRIEIKGAATATLGTLQAAGAAGLTITGQLSGTLGALTSVATGRVSIAGVVSATLGSLTVSATGTVGGGAISGVVSATLGDVTLAATGAQAAATEVTGGSRRHVTALRKAVDKANEALEGVRDAKDRPAALVAAIYAALPAVDDPAGDWAASKMDALRLRSERLASERAKLAQWQADAALAAMILEFRALLDNLALSEGDDEEAITALLLA